VHRQLTWEHLLQQTSQWDGELWGKPTYVDVNGKRLGSVTGTAEPGTGWAYNDVRVNLLGLALTLVFRRPLPEVLHDFFLQPLGSSGQWSWHGYDNSFITIDGSKIQVVSGGAHWGGGVWMSADDLASLGQLYLQHGRWRGAQLVSEEWIERSWLPCAHKPEYGYLWWLNDDKRIFPTAPATARCARGNADRHLLWVDPARDLVIASHWGEDIFRLLEDVSSAIPERTG
jgi:CubicO group peptidase (beta-lactamase class C family)